MQNSTLELNELDKAVQTSLIHIHDNEEKRQLLEKLQELQEDKELLEGKIRGYLTLSDICREYKTDLEELRKEYNKLLRQVQNSSPMSANAHISESPASEPDPGINNGRETGQRTGLQSGNHNTISKPIASSINSSHNITHSLNDDANESGTKLKIGTANSMTHGTSKPNGAQGTLKLLNGTHEISSYMNGPHLKAEDYKHSARMTLSDSYPMQESLSVEPGALDPETSLTGLGFQHVTEKDVQSEKWTLEDGDLIKLNSVVKQNVKDVTDDQDVDQMVQSFKAWDVSNLSEMVDSVNKNLLKMQRYKSAFEVINLRNNVLQKKLATSRKENSQLLEVNRQLEEKLISLNTESSAKISSGQRGWVNVQKSSPSPDASASHSQDNTDVLQQTINQLMEANQRWSNEWEKLKKHYDDRIQDLEMERNRLEKEKTDQKLAEDTKLRDYEKMLMIAKQKREDEEAAKEEVLLQLTTANNKIEAQQQQIAELEDKTSNLTREKHVLETELNVGRERPVMAPNQTTNSSAAQSDLSTENMILRQQLLLFQEDFDRERQDRAKAQSMKDEYKLKNENLKKRVRHLEQKSTTLEKQILSKDDAFKQLQAEIDTLKHQNKMFQEQIRTNSSWNQPQRRVVFGQVVQTPPVQRPMQHLVPQSQYGIPTQQYDQTRMSPFTGGVYQPATGNVGPPGMISPTYNPGNFGNRATDYTYNGPWTCNQCTYINYPERTVCEVCGYIQNPTNNGGAAVLGNRTEDYITRGEAHRQPPNQRNMFGGVPNGELVMDANRAQAVK